MKTIQLTVDIGIFRIMKWKLSNAPKLFVEGSTQRTKLESERNIPFGKCLLTESEQIERASEIKYKFSIDVENKEAQIYDKMKAFFDERSDKLAVQGWVVLDAIYCFLVDFSDFPDENALARIRYWMETSERIIAGIQALKEIRRTESVGKLEVKHSRGKIELPESFTGETMIAIQESIEKQIRQAADSYRELRRGLGFEWYIALSGENFDWVKIEELIKPKKSKNLRTYKNHHRQETALFLYQFYKRYDRDGDLKKSLVYEMVSRFMEYVGLLDELDEKEFPNNEGMNRYNNSHQERGKNLVAAAQKLEAQQKATGGKLMIGLKYPW